MYYLEYVFSVVILNTKQQFAMDTTCMTEIS